MAFYLSNSDIHLLNLYFAESIWAIVYAIVWYTKSWQLALVVLALLIFYLGWINVVNWLDGGRGAVVVAGATFYWWLWHPVNWIVVGYPW